MSSQGNEAIFSLFNSPPSVSTSANILLSLKHGQKVTGFIGKETYARQLVTLHFVTGHQKSFLCPGEQRCHCCKRGHSGAQHLYCAFFAADGIKPLRRVIHLGTSVPTQWMERLPDFDHQLVIERQEKGGQFRVYRPDYARLIKSEFSGWDIAEDIKRIFAGRISFEGDLDAGKPKHLKHVQ